MCGDGTPPAAIPLFLAGEIPSDRALFTWYHPPPAAVRRRAGIVICPPLGYEYMSSYRALRILAERLAALGFDTLRVDYDGTGNSEGCADDPARVDAWLRTVERAMAEVRRRTESDTMALVGLRAGSILALRAGAAAGSVARIVLWSPFQSGRAYIRELTATARLSAQDDVCDHDAETGINAEGYLFTDETVSDLKRWTLGDLTTSPAGEILILDREDRPVGPALESTLAAAGAAVASIATRETAAMLMPPHLSQLPIDALHDIEEWFRTWHPSPAPAPVPGTTLPVRTASPRSERAVRFGARERLFGILACCDEASDKPAVILLNTGAGHHVGPHRLYVPMARAWAERGHLVLRFDLGGLGDSGLPPGYDLESVAYPEHMLDDAREAIEFVRRQAPQRPIIVAGLCSGGWLAFQAARHDLGVEGVISINAPFYLYDADRQWLRDRRAIARYQRAALDPAKWRKALRGRASYAAFTRLATATLARQISVRLAAAARRAPVDAFARDLCDIAGRGTSCLFVFSSGDNGLAYFLRHAQSTLRRSNVRGLMRHVVVENAGHTFRPIAAQRALAGLLDEFVAAPASAASG